MITGSVRPGHEAMIRLRLRGPAGQEQDLDAMIDTGFNRFLTVPRAVVAALNLPFEAPAFVTLANQSVIVMDYFRGSVLWDGQSRDIPVLAADGTPLVGMALLQGSRLTVDIIDGGNVTIEKLP